MNLSERLLAAIDERQIAGEQIWDADSELRRCAAERKIVEKLAYEIELGHDGFDLASEILPLLAEGYGITEEGK